MSLTNFCSFSQRIKLQLPLHNKRISKRVWGTIWMSSENTEKYKTFPVLIEKKFIKIDQDGKEGVVTIP